MAEQLANLYSTTLASSYTTGAGSISVSSATGAPGSGTFSLTILDASSGAVKLIFRVTSVSGTTFTGASEGPDANANSGDVVVGTMLTAAAVTQLFTDHAGSGVSNGYGALASIGSGSAAGDRYVASDSAFDEYRWNGATWDAFASGILCSNPTASTFPTAKATGGVSLTSFSTSNGVLILSAWRSSGSDNLVAQFGTYPSPPFTQRLRYRFITGNPSLVTSAGLVIYNSTSDKAILFGHSLRGNVFSTVGLSYNTVTSGGISFYANANQGAMTSHRGGLLDVQYTDDGTNRIISLAVDGRNVMEWYTESNTTTFTPSHIGIGMETLGVSSANSDIMSIYDWS